MRIVIFIFLQFKICPNKKVLLFTRKSSNKFLDGYNNASKIKFWAVPPKNSNFILVSLITHWLEFILHELQFSLFLRWLGINNFKETWYMTNFYAISIWIK